MNQIPITVTNITLVLQQYDTINVYSNTSTTPYPFTNLIGQITIEAYQTTYWFTDLNGTSGTYYTTAYYNSQTQVLASQTVPILGGEPSKVGYTFKNYSAPPNEWGQVLTPDDMRYTYLWGIDTTASDINMSEWQDEQWDYLIQSAVADWESFLKIDIRRRRRVTYPTSNMNQSTYWYPNCDYTDVEEPYDFDPQLFANFGFLQLRHYPVVPNGVSRAQAISVVGGVILDFVQQQWVRLQPGYGQLGLYPTNGWNYGPFTYGLNIWSLGWNYAYPQGIIVDYDSGYVSSDMVPAELRNMIGMWAALLAMNIIGDGLLVGFSSASISLDGLSESFSSTQSPENAFFGGRLRSYERIIQLWIQRNRQKYSIPIRFVGV